jgi:biotin carboxyl carrier protein
MPDRTIKCPLPGTFYRRPSPEADPYLSEGDHVSAGDVVGMVEVMKSFHEVQSEEDGVLAQFLVDNDDVVEAGQDVAILS